MSNRITISGLVMFCTIVVFIVGCIPEDSLEWSNDGSVGLLRTAEGLYLVNGKTGELSEFVRGNISLLPDLSEDGSLVAYSQEVECTSLSEGLKLLPPGQVKMIEYSVDPAFDLRR